MFVRQLLAFAAVTLRIAAAGAVKCCAEDGEPDFAFEIRPLTHREYYELLAFFNQTADADRYDQGPTLLTPTKRQRQLKEELDRALAENQRQHHSLVKALAKAQREWEAALAATAPA